MKRFLLKVLEIVDRLCTIIAFCLMVVGYVRDALGPVEFYRIFRFSLNMKICYGVTIFLFIYLFLSFFLEKALIAASQPKQKWGGQPHPI